MRTEDTDMRWPLFWSMALVAWAFQVTLAGDLGRTMPAPDLLAAAAVVAAIRAPDLRGAFLASWSIGWLRDLGSVGPPGLCSLWLPAAGLLLRASAEYFDAGTVWVGATVGLAGLLLVRLVEGGILYVVIGSVSLPDMIVHAVAGAGTAAAAVPVMLWILDRSGGLATPDRGFTKG